MWKQLKIGVIAAAAIFVLTGCATNKQTVGQSLVSMSTATETVVSHTPTPTSAPTSTPTPMPTNTPTPTPTEVPNPASLAPSVEDHK